MTARPNAVQAAASLEPKYTNVVLTGMLTKTLYMWNSLFLAGMADTSYIS
jgi:hypothetical protein